jgi:hypothetical protein
MRHHYGKDYLIEADQDVLGLPGQELAALAAALAVNGGAQRLRIAPQDSPGEGFEVEVTPAIQRRCRKLARKARELFRRLRKAGRRSHP